MQPRIRTAVFPVAGLGTRFLPVTKTVPKEMLPVVDRPALQYVVDEAKEAGIEHFVFVTGRNKGIIEDHFDHQVELEETLRARGKEKELALLARDMPAPGAMSFTRQQAPLGLGHAVWCARDIVGRAPFAVLLPDMLMQGTRGCLAEMMAVYLETGGNVVGLGECHPSQTRQYGIVALGEEVRAGEAAGAPSAWRITGMVEKPAPEEAPSNLYINGRYIFQPEIFDLLANQRRGAGGEIQLTDAMLALADAQPFYGHSYRGRVFDTGSKAGFLAANFAYALAREDVAAELRTELARLVGEA